ncbi:MAG: Rieske 2Fe-2S domain-containing protein [Burkholderiales bacterium]
MLSREDNELLTHVGPGTAMGALFRRHWLPFMLADELAVDAPPIRIELLGEGLVAFRDSRGRPGLLGEHCPHRRASLCLGKNAEGGLRCAYHAWKFDVAGRCLDMPSEPSGSGFREKVRALAYPVVERAGLLWAYLGPAEKRAELPEFEWLGIATGQRTVSRRVLECSFAQGIEGDIDETTLFPQDSAPRYTVHEAPYGLACGARRQMDGDRHLWRINLFLMPCFTLVAPEDGSTLRRFRAWVPMDDERIAVFAVSWNGKRPADAFEPARKDELIVSAGPIADRALEHLGTSDKAVIAFRQRMLAEAKRLREGLEPQSPYDPDCYRVRAHAVVAPRDERDFIEREEIRRAMLAP